MDTPDNVVALKPQVEPLPSLGNPMQSTKTYGHEVGLSVAFRQHRARSHCRFIHGYALGVKFTFATWQTDHCGWVVDFGGLKDLKGHLDKFFDHRLLVSADDPHLEVFQDLHLKRIADVHIVPATGCEAFARMIYEFTTTWLVDAGFSPRVMLQSVEVSEHGGNSAICCG